MNMKIKTAAAQEKPAGGSTWAIRRLIAIFSGRGAREGYLAGVDQGVISLSNFLATVMLARVVSPTELGIYGVGFTSLRLVRAVQEGLVIQPMNTFGAAMDEQDFRRYSTSMTVLQVLLALAGGLLAAAAGWLLTVTGNDVAGPTLFSLWSAFIFWQLQEYVRRVLYTRGEVFQAVLNTVLSNLVRLALMLWLISQGKLTGISGLHAIAWGSLAALIPGVWQMRRHLAAQADSLLATWKRNWEFGSWIVGSTLANWVAVEFYPVLTAGLINFAAAGAYRAIQNLVAPIHLLLRAIDTFLAPRAARAYDEGGRPALRRLIYLTYSITGIPILGVLGLAVLFPTYILRFLYGETYLPYSDGIILMAIFYALMFFYWPYQTALKATHHSRPLFTGNLLAIVAMFTIGLWMIYQWGVYGTIAGQILNALVVAIVLWAGWRRVKSDPAQTQQPPGNAPVPVFAPAEPEHQEKGQRNQL